MAALSVALRIDKIRAIGSMDNNPKGFVGVCGFVGVLGWGGGSSVVQLWRVGKESLVWNKCCDHL